MAIPMGETLKMASTHARGRADCDHAVQVGGEVVELQ